MQWGEETRSRSLPYFGKLSTVPFMKSGRGLPDMLAAKLNPSSAEPLIRSGMPTYASVYESGFRGLRFPEPIESEYRRVNAPVIHRRLAIVGLVGILALGFWMLLDGLTTGYFQFPVAWIALGGCTTPLLLSLVLFDLPGRRKTPVSVWLLFCIDLFIGLSLLWLELVMESRQLPGARYPYVALLVIMAAIFTSGFMTWRATLAGLLIMLAYGISHALLVEQGVFPLSHALYFMFLILVIGANASWRLEHSGREHFLMVRMLAELSEQDSLTGLFNHAAFMMHGQRVWRQAKREGKKIGLLSADIDYFKRFNDYYGHLAGDECIRRVGSVMAASAQRGLDMAGRLGGEEFSVFWYDLSADQLARKAQDIRAAIHELDISHACSNVSSRVTVSIGIICMAPGQEEEHFREALSRADKALYAAKKGGRNRIVQT